MLFPQLFPKGPEGPKRLTDEEVDAGVASHTIELPRTVAADPNAAVACADGVATGNIKRGPRQ